VDRERPILKDPILWLVFLLATGLRLFMFPMDRPLWTDEALLAINIVDRGFLELLQPLSRDQNSPPGFLFMERLMVLVFGPNEYAMRLVPLLAGVGSVVLFARLLSRVITDRRVIRFGTLLFALSAYLVYYSVEVKQYAMDVLATLVMLLTTLHLLRTGKFSRRQILLLAGVGHAALLVSHASLFVLAACGLVLAGTAAAAGQVRRVLILVTVGAAWISHVVLFYILIYRHGVANETLQTYFASGFMPLNADFIPWVRDAIWLMRDPVGFGVFPAWVTVTAAGFGLVCLWLARGWRLLACTLGPIAIAAAASAAEVYPLYGRLFLFAVPLILLGFCFLVAWAYDRSVPLGHLLAVLLLVSAAHRLVTFTPPARLDSRSAFAIAAKQAQPGDVLVVVNDAAHHHHLSSHVAAYYHLVYGLAERQVPLVHQQPRNAAPGKVAAAGALWIIYAAAEDGSDPIPLTGAQHVHSGGRIRLLVRR
jgi:hypothetical protein